jgi:hypothetical protein
MNPTNMLVRYAMKRAGIKQNEWSNKTLSLMQKDFMKAKIKEVQNITNLKII